MKESHTLICIEHSYLLKVTPQELQVITVTTTLAALMSVKISYKMILSVLKQAM